MNVDFVAEGEKELRHEGHHHHGANIKYGYIVFGVSFVYFLVRIGLNRYGSTRSNKGGASKISGVYRWIDIGLWVAVILVMGVLKIDFPEQYITSVKRFGRLAYCLIPLDILLALRPNLSDYMGLLMLHKWVSRLIIGSGTIHSIGFFYKWVSEGTLLQKSFKILNSLGIVVFILSLALLALSIRAFRRFNYKVFYILHNVTVFAFVILIIFHARPGVNLFALINVALLFVQVYLRFFRSYSPTKVEVKENSKSSLQLVRISLPEYYPNWIPCSHIRICPNWAWFLASHPYTIASTTEDETLELVVRKSSFSFSKSVSYQLSNPFPSLGLSFFNGAKSISIACGGSGISFGLPLLKYVKTHEQADISLIWCTPYKEDLFILKEYPFCEHIKIFITRLPISEYELEYEQEYDEENIEMQSILSSNSLIDSSEDVHSQLKLGGIKNGRPKLEDEIILPSETTYSTDCWLIACGPASLVEDSRTVAKRNEMKFLYESYDM